MFLLGLLQVSARIPYHQNRKGLATALWYRDFCDGPSGIAAKLPCNVSRVSLGRWTAQPRYLSHAAKAFRASLASAYQKHVMDPHPGCL